MPVITVWGTLRGIGGNVRHERQCRVQTTRTEIRVAEEERPIDVRYSHTNILDSDNFPDGDYEMEYEGGTLELTKRGGVYVARRR